MNLHKNFGTIAATLAVVSLSLTALAQTATTQSKTNVDSMFLQAASAGNAFEIETSNLAVQKSSSAEIKKFAQMMIAEHTQAQKSVTTLLGKIGGASDSSSGNGTAGNGSTGTGTTGTGSSGTGSTGTGTTGGTGSTGTGTSGTGTGTAGAGSTGTTGTGTGSAGTTGTGTTGTTGTGTGTTGGSNNTMTGTGAASSMASMMNMLTPDQHFRVLTLASLSGQNFDKAYIKEQVNSHEATITVFAYASKNASNAEVKAFAAKTLPTIEKHYREAVALAK